MVCESSPDRLEETQILEFCANFLENRLEEREATKNMEVTQKDDLESDETDSNTERHKTLNLSAIDSGRSRGSSLKAYTLANAIQSFK